MVPPKINCRRRLCVYAPLIRRSQPSDAQVASIFSPVERQPSSTVKDRWMPYRQMLLRRSSSASAPRFGGPVASPSPRRRIFLRGVRQSGCLAGRRCSDRRAGCMGFQAAGQWHTFWNAGDAPCEIIEVISPAGFEDYFRDLSTIWPDRTKAGELFRRYEVDMDFESVPQLCVRFGLISGRPGGIVTART